MAGNVSVLNQAFISDIRITASDTHDVAAGLSEVCEVPIPYDTSGTMLNNLQQNIPANNQDTADSLSSRRIVLLGKSGGGKSAAGNTILGQKEFRSLMSTNSVTSECSEAHATVSGRSVSVVDTPGFFDTKMKPEELVIEIARSVYLSSPGPHAFLIVLRADDRFTVQEQQILQMIEMLFGKEVLKYSIILFTHGDQFEGESVEELMQENSNLRDLVQQCGGRFHVFNNKDQNNREQVNDLLQKIDTMIEQNGGGHYSNQMFEDAQRFRREEKEQRQREEEERRQRGSERRGRDENRQHVERGENRAQIEAQNNGPNNGFLLFLSRYRRQIIMAAVAVGFVIVGALGRAVGGPVVGGANEDILGIASYSIAVVGIAFVTESHKKTTI